MLLYDDRGDDCEFAGGEERVGGIVRRGRGENLDSLSQLGTVVTMIS
jgi:hypothetical protein